MQSAEKLKFYNSWKWKKTRKRYIATTNGLCNRCYYQDGIYQAGTTVHHIKYLTQNDYANLTSNCYDFANLELLCRPCHEKEHGRLVEPLPKGYKFNFRGDIVKI